MGNVHREKRTPEYEACEMKENKRQNKRIRTNGRKKGRINHENLTKEKYPKKPECEM